MSDLELTIAINDYDHVRDVTAGRIPVNGIALRALHLPVEHIFARFYAHREWDISEFSLGKYTAMVASGDDSLVGVPVFPSRMFRHSSIYVRADNSMTSMADLATKRIGVPEWAQTAAVYSRGILQHYYGVDLMSVRWTQGGVNEPGRREKVELNLPAGLKLASVADRSLNEMLLAGDLDAVLSARPPAGLATGGIRRLVADYQEVERAFYKETGVFPIMHVLAIRREVYERYPWVARNLVEAFELAKRASLARMADVTASWVPLPWIPAIAADAVELFGDDPWPYGVDANRTTLETFLSYAAEQGVCSRRLEPEELFPASALMTVKV